MRFTHGYYNHHRIVCGWYNGHKIEIEDIIRVSANVLERIAIGEAVDGVLSVQLHYADAENVITNQIVVPTLGDHHTVSSDSALRTSDRADASNVAPRVAEHLSDIRTSDRANAGRSDPCDASHSSSAEAESGAKGEANDSTSCAAPSPANARSIAKADNPESTVVHSLRRVDVAGEANAIDATQGNTPNAKSASYEGRLAPDKATADKPALPTAQSNGSVVIGNIVSIRATIDVSGGTESSLYGAFAPFSAPTAKGAILHGDTRAGNNSAAESHDPTPAAYHGGLYGSAQPASAPLAIGMIPDGDAGSLHDSRAINADTIAGAKSDEIKIGVRSPFRAPFADPADHISVQAVEHNASPAEPYVPTVSWAEGAIAADNAAKAYPTIAVKAEIVEKTELEITARHDYADEHFGVTQEHTQRITEEPDGITAMPNAHQIADATQRINSNSIPGLTDEETSGKESALPISSALDVEVIAVEHTWVIDYSAIWAGIIQIMRAYEIDAEADAITIE